MAHVDESDDYQRGWREGYRSGTQEGLWRAAHTVKEKAEEYSRQLKAAQEHEASRND